MSKILYANLSIKSKSKKRLKAVKNKLEQLKEEKSERTQTVTLSEALDFLLELGEEKLGIK